MKSIINESPPKAKIIKKWEKELKPKEYSSFIEFHQYQKDHATFNRCYTSQQDVTIFFHCRECCKSSTGLFCAYCFNRSQHANHHVSVMLLDDAFCDCGDPKYIKKESWCSLHRQQHQDIIIQDEYLTLLKTKIYEIFDYAIKNPDKKSFSDAIQFLLNITEWGSTYIDLISQVLYDGYWENSFYGKCIRSYKTLSPPNIEQFRRLLLKMVSSPIFRKGFILCIVETLEVLRHVFSDDDFPMSMIDLVDFAYQCLQDGKIDVELQESDEICTKIMNFMVDMYSSPPFVQNGQYIIPINYNVDFMNFYSSIIYAISENSFFCKSIIKQPDCLKSIIRLLSINSQNAIIKRITDNKVTNTGIHFFQHKNITAFRAIYEFFARNLPILTVNFEDDINFIEILEYPIESLNDSYLSTLNTALSIMSNELDKILEVKSRDNSFGSSSYFIQPFTDEFVINHPLAKLFISCATCFSIFNNVELFAIFDRIGFNKFDQLAAIFASCEAGKCQIIDGLFPMNDDSIELLGYQSDYICFFVLPALQSIMSIKSNINGVNLSGDIVIIIAESFGLPIWEKEQIPTDCHKWNNVITSMLRLFINMACNDNFFNFLFDHEKVRRMIIDFIYAGQSEKIKIIDRASDFIYEADFIDEEFDKIIDIRVDVQGSHLSLKPEYDDTSSVFSPFLSVSEFNKMLAYEISTHKERLLRLKVFDPPEVLSGLKAYLQTKEMRTVIHRVLTAMLNDTEKFSVACSHTLFSLIRLILLESENPEETEKIFIESNIINLLIQLVKKLDNGVLFLRSFVNECKLKYMKISEIVEKEIKEDISKIKKNKMKIDKAKILAQFANSQKAFEAEHEEELKTIQNSSPSSFTCSFCQDSFNSEKPYGILTNIFKSSLLNNIEATVANDTIERFPALCQIRSCGHFAHKCCFEQKNETENNFIINDAGRQCPLDRSYSNAIIPAFDGDKPDEKLKEAFQALIDLFIHFCDASAQQCLAYNISLVEVLARQNPKYIDDKKNVLCLIHLLRACFFMDPVVPLIGPADPFVEFTYGFCQGGNFQNAQKKFNNLLPQFWRKLVMSASIVDEDQQLQVIETYIRRISLLEQFAFLSDKDPLYLPTVSEFIEAHNLTSLEKEMKNIHVDIEKVSFLSPCIKYVFPNLKEVFTDYILDSTVIQENQHSHFEFCHCLLCGKMCCIQTFIQDNHTSNPKVPFLYDHCMKCTGNLCTPILFLTGDFANSICIWDGDFQNKCFIDSIYTDKYGDQNVGLKGGNMLYLNKYRVANLIESLITGEIRRKLEGLN